LSDVPGTETLAQKSSRSLGISVSARRRLASVLAMPTSSHMMRPSSRWISRMLRRPLIDSRPVICFCTRSADSLNASWSVVTFGSEVLAR
jgi:hypothetical protein